MYTNKCCFSSVSFFYKCHWWHLRSQSCFAYIKLKIIIKYERSRKKCSFLFAACKVFCRIMCVCIDGWTHEKKTGHKWHKNMNACCACTINAMPSEKHCVFSFNFCRISTHTQNDKTRPWQTFLNAAKIYCVSWIHAFMHTLTKWLMNSKHRDLLHKLTSGNLIYCVDFSRESMRTCVCLHCMNEQDPIIFRLYFGLFTILNWMVKWVRANDGDNILIWIWIVTVLRCAVQVYIFMP